jgi:hypothetical protein
MTVKTTVGRVGDRLEVHVIGGGLPRHGWILEVLGGPGHEHYLVRWSDDHESIHYPSEGTRIEPARHA